MFDRDGSEQPKYRGLIFSVILAFVCCLAVWYVYENAHSNERRNASATASYERFTECIASRKASAAQCNMQAENYRYDQSAEAYDLKAQQEMARWAALMLVVTSVGVFFVAGTFGQAAETNKAAQGAVEAANKQTQILSQTEGPFFFIQLTNVDSVFDRGAGGDGFHSCTARCSVANHGRAPAILNHIYWGYRNEPALPERAEYPGEIVRQFDKVREPGVVRNVVRRGRAPPFGAFQTVNEIVPPNTEWDQFGLHLQWPYLPGEAQHYVAGAQKHIAIFQLTFTNVFGEEWEMGRAWEFKRGYAESIGGSVWNYYRKRQSTGD